MDELGRGVDEGAEQDDDEIPAIGSLDSDELAVLATLPVLVDDEQEAQEGNDEQ